MIEIWNSNQHGIEFSRVWNQHMTSVGLKIKDPPNPRNLFFFVGWKLIVEGWLLFWWDNGTCRPFHINTITIRDLIASTSLSKTPMPLQVRIFPMFLQLSQSKKAVTTIQTKHHPNFGLWKTICTVNDSIQAFDAKSVKTTYPSLQITAKAPENICLEDEISFQNLPFSGSGQ